MTATSEGYYDEKRLTFIIRGKQYGKVLDTLREAFSVVEAIDEQNDGEDILILRDKKITK